MKTSSKTIKNVMIIIFKVFMACVLFLFSCTTLNFMLVPPSMASIVETIVTDAKQQTQNIDMCFFGSSRTYRAIDSKTLSNNLNKNIFNIAYENANYFATYFLLTEFMKTNNPETVFLEVSTTNFTRDTTTEELFIHRCLTGKEKDLYAQGIELEYFDSKLFDFTNHLKNFSNGRFSNNVSLKIMHYDEIGESINNIYTTYMGNGFLYSTAEIKGNDVSLPLSYFTNGIFWDNSFVNDIQLEYFIKIIELCEDNNIQLVLYSPPYPTSIINKHHQDIALFETYVNDLSNYYNLKYLDFSKTKKQHIQFTTQYFYNANHCNGVGATALEPILEDVITDLQSNTYNSSNWFYNNYAEMMQDMQ